MLTIAFESFFVKESFVKRLLLLPAIILLLGSPAIAAPNYEVLINDKVHDVELGKEYELALGEGMEKVRLSVRVKEEQTFNDSFVSFKYKKKFSLTESGIHEGVNQVLLNSALGTIIIIQEYSTVNPSGLTAFFLNELTAEERAAGYTQNTKPYERKTSGGILLKGIEALVEKGEQRIQYIVSAFGNDKSGILIAVRLDTDFQKSDGELIEDFWNSLSVALGKEQTPES